MDLKNVCQNISKFIVNANNNLEIEVKFRNISKDEFMYIIEYLKNLYENKKETTIDYYVGGQRITKKDNLFYLTTKKSISEPFFLTHKERELKFTLAEEKLELLDRKTIRKYDFSRVKNRTFFTVGNFSLDLTEVTRDEDVNYEFEIEVIDPKIYDPNNFEKIINEYVLLLNMNEINPISFCNYNLSNGKSIKGDTIERKYISRPRDLIKEDVTYPNSILRGFTVSIKADGVQKFLIFFRNSIYLGDVNNPPEYICPLPKENFYLDNSIFVGELISRSQLKKENVTDFMNVFLPFDSICFQGDILINRSYLERFDFTEKIKNLEIYCDSVKNIKVFEKKIFNLGLQSSYFYENFEKCYQEKKNIIYHDDGYIFTPINSPYVAEGQNKNQKDRKLSNYYDVCKFKPKEKKSIDFLVKDKKIYFFDKRKQKLIPFDRVKYSLKFSDEIDDKIVEFFPHFEGDNVILKPSRIREDKTYPNERDQVNVIVKSYTEKNAITEETLRGNDTVLMRQFQNFHEKRNLINTLEGYVIDIGSGKGGDIYKFLSNRKVKKILSVEPNTDFAEEFKRRLDDSGEKDKFQLLYGVKGEDKAEIVSGMDFFPKNMKGETLNITFMISLSFFWSSFEKLKELADTINSINREYKSRQGNIPLKIIFYTINGYQVEKFFNNIGKNEVNLNTISLSFNGENELKVNISDSKTVFSQTEYLVKIDQLTDLIGGEIIENRVSKVFNLLMSKPELTYISMFSRGTIVINKSVQLIYSEKRIEVNEHFGIELDNKILAEGEDTLKSVTHIGKDIYRVGTLDLKKSIAHSVIKLVNTSYRNANVYKRIELVEDFNKFKDIKELAEILDVEIKIYDGDDISRFNSSSHKTINLYKCIDKTYEPLVQIKGENIFYSFK
jgi:hypothetical protein